MKELKIKNILNEVETELNFNAQKYPYLTPTGINFSKLPNISRLLQNDHTASKKDFESMFVFRDKDNYKQLFNLIIQKNFNYDVNFSVWKVFEELHKRERTIPANSKSNFYTDTINEIHNLVQQIVNFSRESKNNQNTQTVDDPEIPLISTPEPNYQGEFTIDSFKSLSNIIKSTPQFKGVITDKDFYAFEVETNPEIQHYYDLIVNGSSEHIENPVSSAQKVYWLYQELGKECTRTISSHATIKYHMDKLQNYYGISGTALGNKGKVQKEFSDTKSIVGKTLQNHELIEFKYKLYEANGSKYYLNANIEYYKIFDFTHLRHSYSFVDTKDKNISFYFDTPVPITIETNKIYNIRYSSITADDIFLRIKFISIRTQKASVVQYFEHCTAADQLKEFLMIIRKNTDGRE